MLKMSQTFATFMSCGTVVEMGTIPEAEGQSSLRA